jgi:CHAT domain-containing protein/Tfp pilus assembly protein PilF
MARRSRRYSDLGNRCKRTVYQSLTTIWMLFIFVGLLTAAPPPRAFRYTLSLSHQSTKQLSGTSDEKDVRALEPGKPIERELTDGQQHTYQIELKADQFLKAAVKQQGVDIVVQVLGPNGRQIAEVNAESRLQGREEVLLAAEATGMYWLTVRPNQKEVPAGSYEIRIEELRAATENDRILQEARNLHEKCRKLLLTGKYDGGVQLAERILEIRERVLGPRHADVAAAIDNLAVFYYYNRDLAKAELLYRRALSIRRTALGEEHPDVALSLYSLALIYRDQGDYAKAEPLYEQALAILEKTLRPEHLLVARMLNNLANLYSDRGNYAKSESMHQRVLAIWEKALGSQDRVVAIALNNLALLYSRKGDYPKAEMLHQRALAINEKALGPEHPTLAVSLNNLAGLYADLGDYSKAEMFHQRALTIREKSLGPEHLAVTSSLHGLANLYRDRGEYRKAEPLYQRALAIRERELGPEHPRVAVCLNDLASLYHSSGRYWKAESLLQRTLAIREKVLGAEHPDVATTLSGLARLNAAKGDIAKAITFQLRANAVAERNLMLNLALGSERQKLAYLALFSEQTDLAFSLHSESAPSDSQALYLAFTTLLHRKGRGLDAIADTIANLRRHATLENQALLDQLVEARSHLAATALREPDRTNLGVYRTRLKLLEEKVENIEAQLSARSAEFRAQAQPVTLSAVQAALPRDSALVEFAVFTPRYPRTGKSKPPRYLVYVLTARGQPKWVDLGNAAIIDRAVDAWRQALRDPNRRDVKRLAREADEKIMRPVRSLLGELRHLLIAPDGLLNLIPFAALMNERYQYLAERYTVSYLTSGRDLLRLQTTAPSLNAPLIMANPIFGRVETLAVRGSHDSGNSQAGDQVWGQIDPAVIFFQSLPGTEHEALAIKALLPEASLLLRERATETALKQSKAPRILHIATHGFFLSDQEAPPAEIHDIPGDDALRVPLRLSKRAAKIENPLLRSGLALAGVNEHQRGDDDGVVTALEVASLNLWGTRLVVLSGCDTGVGEVKNGEGVYGLRRALVLAGSETQIMSLWPVPDNETGNFMADYYRRLLKGEGRGEALRQIQLKMLKNAKLRHPHYWGSFIQAGEWANLEGQR